MAETGHAKNVEHFQQLIAFVTGMGVAYNPTPVSLKLPALQAKLAAANDAVAAVIGAVTAAKAVINNRENTFDGLRKLTTRVVNFYAASGADENRVDDAKSLKRKIDGKRAEVLKDDPSTPADETANSISVSQQSYTQLTEHFEALIRLVEADALYNPNEEELKVATLEALLDDLNAANTAVIAPLVAQSNARGARDTVMYQETSGLVDVAQSVKKYVKAAFGTDSLQFNQIKGLQFRRPTDSLALV